MRWIGHFITKLDETLGAHEVTDAPSEDDSCSTQAQHKHACVGMPILSCMSQNCNQNKSDLLGVSWIAFP